MILSRIPLLESYNLVQREMYLKWLLLTFLFFFVLV